MLCIRSWTAVFGALAVLGCSFEGVDLVGRACPCVEGYHCAAGVCVFGADVDAGPDAARPDASRDARAPVPDAASDAPSDGGIDGRPVGDGGRDTGVPLDDTACDDRYAGAVLCEGFEDPDLTSWAPETSSGGSIRRETADAYRGRGILVADVPGGGSHAVLERGIPAIAGADVYLRYYVKVSASAFDNVGLSYLYEDVPPYTGTLVTLVSDHLSMWVGSAGGSTWHEPMTAIPRDTWVCIESHVRLDSATGSAELWLDGERIVYAPGISTRPGAGSFGLMRVGVTATASSQPPVVVRVDELVLDTRPIGCD